MKTIAIVLFTALTFASCGAGNGTSTGKDSTKVVVDTTKKAVVDTTKKALVDTTKKAVK